MLSVTVSHTRPGRPINRSRTMNKLTIACLIALSAVYHQASAHRLPTSIALLAGPQQESAATHTKQEATQKAEIEVLLKDLKHPDQSVRLKAINALGRMGP